MDTILKYSVPQPSPKTGQSKISIPMHSTLLAVDDDGTGRICAWVKCSVDAMKAANEVGCLEDMTFLLVNTGDKFTCKGEYIKTLTIYDPPFMPTVWHIFRVVG